MKRIYLLSMIPGAALAFQQVAPIHRRSIGHEELLDRAEQCAALYDFCDVDELETLADDLEQLQSSHQKMYDILRSQSELKRLMEGHAVDNHRDLETKSNDVYGDYLHYHW
eukprot:122587_1